MTKQNTTGIRHIGIEDWETAGRRLAGEVIFDFSSPWYDDSARIQNIPRSEEEDINGQWFHVENYIRP